MINCRMTPFIENLVLACIVAIVLFFGYHIAMHLIQKQTKQIVMEMNTPKHIPTIENLSNSPPAPVPAVAPEPTIAPPDANDPNAKTDGSATFTTDLRQPENLYGSHAYIESNEKALPAQNEDSMGDISAWDGDIAQPFSLI